MAGVLLKLWKPFGVLTQFTDREGRATLADYCSTPNVYAAGRLDRDSEGLLILTDEGAIAHRLTNPTFDHAKTYWAQVEHVPSVDALNSLRNGLVLNDGPTKPARAQLLDRDAAEAFVLEREPPIRCRATIPTAWLELTISEGRNRQVRRMTAAVGHPTLRLVRHAIGDVTLQGMAPGECVPLTEAESATVRSMAGGRRQTGSPAARTSRGRQTSRSSRRGGGGSRP